jgi:redox-sensitive bicupin YhaK (pirin superfamily)
MIQIRKSKERGHANHGWLDSYHTFSFADYFDQNFMGFRKLRVINEDQVMPGQGFPTHSHRDMEIITYVLEGQIEHKDSMGNQSVIRPGDVQRMSAGTGVTHSEFNPSPKDILHLLQIWILPEKAGIKPSYEQKTYNKQDKLNRLRLVASKDGQEDTVKIHQDACLYAAVLEEGKKVEHSLKKGRHAWLQVTCGALSVNNVSMNEGDGAAISDEELLTITAKKLSEIILFDLA